MFFDVITLGLAGVILDLFFPKTEVEVYAERIDADGALVYLSRGRERTLDLPKRLRVRWSVDGTKFVHRLPEDIKRGQKLKLKGRRFFGRFIELIEVDILEPLFTEK